MKRLLALWIAIAVAAPLAMNAWSQGEDLQVADESQVGQEQDTVGAAEEVISAEPVKRELKVIVEKPQPPTCNITCEYVDPRTSDRKKCNGREGTQAGLRSGQIKLKWNTTGASAVVIKNGNASFLNGLGATGEAVIGAGANGFTFSMGPWYNFNLEATNDGGKCTDFVQGRFSCFLKGTKILMQDGTQKNIEDIKAGEVVMAYDFEKSQLVASKVQQAVQAVTDKWYLVNDNLRVSIGHQIYANGSWTWSEELKLGDKLFNAAGEEVSITALQAFDDVVDVYDLQTDYPNDFFAENYLVHNRNQGEKAKEKGLAAGTKIALADGRLIPIEQIKAGDKIFAYNFKTKSYVASTVRATNSHKANGYLLVNNKLKMAKHHPLYSVALKSKTK
ncbi:MAG: hypothetical protein HY922_01610 [Elusimicrobia bacterium]|nr:hypothetical protein [Elusimicrobiota bacterium]